MPVYSKESLETLRQKIDLADLLASHLDLKKAGAAYKALCPFHDEKTPSFTLQKGDTHYHCFGCGAHGDGIQFLMTHLKMGFSDAVDSLAQRYHVHLEHVEGTAEQKGPPKALIKEALEQASRFYHFYLLHTPEGHAALRYLYSRGLDLDFIRHFMIGLAPSTPHLFRKVMHGKAISDEIMEAAGLLAARENGGWRDFFSDRITFPICDATGAVIGFSARKYKEETFGGKYVNTSETALFKKSKVLFGLHHSRKRIAKERKALIVEGQIDALRLIQVGFNITVAGQGTAFGEGHVKELMTLGVNLVYLSLDSDNAGNEATSKIGDLFQKQGVEVRIVQMPAGMDPDSFLREHGANDFLKLLDESIDYLTFIVSYQSRHLNVNSPAGKNELIQLVTKQVRTWNHPVMVQESLRKLAFLTQVSEEMIGAIQDHTPNIYIRKPGNIGLETIDPDRILESDFLRWLLLTGEMQSRFSELAKVNITHKHFRSDVCRQIYSAFIERFEKDQQRDLTSLMLAVEHPEAQKLISDLTHKKINREKAEEHYAETLQKMLDRHWMQQRETVKMKIQSGQCSDEELLLLLKELDNLKNVQPKIIDSTH